jgi:nucleotide-binding universal stress UspA family protein
MKVLIAYDGSGCADAALDDLRRAGLPKVVEALVISVAEVWLPPPPPSSYEIVEAAEEARTPAELEKAYWQHSPAVNGARQLASQARARLERSFPEWSVSMEAFVGSPAHEIVRKADEWQPDLIVVGSHGRSALGRLVLGSVSQKVVTEARASVRVARGRIEVDESPVRILIGVDGSFGSQAAVRAVAARSWMAGSEARVCIVDDPLVPTLIGRIIPPVAEMVEESNRGERLLVGKIADAATDELRAAGLNASSRIIEGDPKKDLVREAERWGADSIFVGSTGSSSALERFLMGSVSAAVAARAHCSVEVVRAKREHAANS